MWRGLQAWEARSLTTEPEGHGRGAPPSRTQAPEAPESRVGYINCDRKRVCANPDTRTGSQAPGRARPSTASGSCPAGLRRGL